MGLPPSAQHPACPGRAHSLLNHQCASRRGPTALPVRPAMSQRWRQTAAAHQFPATGLRLCGGSVRPAGPWKELTWERGLAEGGGLSGEGQVESQRQGVRPGGCWYVCRKASGQWEGRAGTWGWLRQEPRKCHSEAWAGLGAKGSPGLLAGGSTVMATLGPTPQAKKSQGGSTLKTMLGFHPVSTGHWQQGLSSDREMSLSRCPREARAGWGQEKAHPWSSRSSGGQQGEMTDQPFRGAQGLPWGLCRLTSWALTIPQRQDTHSHLWGDITVTPIYRVGN